MKSITRLSLALMMFALFSISYLVTTVSAYDQKDYNAPGMKKNEWGVRPQTSNTKPGWNTNNNTDTTKGYNASQGNAGSYNGNVQQDHNRGIKNQWGVRPQTSNNAPHTPDSSNNQGASGSSYHLNQPVNQGGLNGVLPGPQ
jgi:hypothetical protein